MGRRQGRGPRGRGLLGSLPTVDAGLLRSCACHSAFGNFKSLRSRPQVSLKAQWPDLQWACGPKPTTEPAVFCASVPQRSQRILWEVISKSAFDRVVGRAQASKTTLERLENKLTWVQNEPKWLPGGLQGDPWRPLGGPGARRANFERFWEPFGRTPKSLKSELKFSLKSSSTSERHFGPLGAVLGSILGSFWGRLGLCFAVRWPNTKTLIFDDPLE